MAPSPQPPAARPIDPVALSQALIRCDSVTPRDGGALEVLAGALEALGFACHRLRFEGDGSPPVENLYAQRGEGRPNFCFAGHTDVVPPGEVAAWSARPFDAEVRDGALYGRGAADMKSAIAAFVAATDRFLAGRGDDVPGAISLLITGDEEGPAINGTAKVLGWLRERGIALDACVVGEPTNPERLGDMIKIGRRGSLSGVLTVEGVQGHVAYPHLADNPLPRLVRLLGALSAAPLDDGTPHFQASNLEITSIDVGNEATNVIPGRATARFNIRFNDLHSAASLEAWLRETLDAAGGGYGLSLHCSGESFLTPPGRLSDIVADAAERRLGRRPALSTTGGTSDARFIKDACPVVEFGLVGQTMHKIDERTDLADIGALTDIYHDVLDAYFAG